jgi:hypothetical protein
MKVLLHVVLILTVVFLVSCKDTKENGKIQESKPPQRQGQTAKVETEYVKGQKMTDAAIHTAIVQEVINGNSYTYLKGKEGDAVFWMAVTRREMKVGESITFRNPLEMPDFTSKELQKTFETIYFVSEIGNESSHFDTKPAVANPHAGLDIEAKKISVEPIEGGVSIGDLISNRDSYSKKVIRIKGKVVKFSKAIMGKNWVHLQDGTGEPGSDDLLVTTQDAVAVGDVVVFEGTITLNKDFGSGYSYEILMEEAKLQSE